MAGGPDARCADRAREREDVVGPEEEEGLWEGGRCGDTSDQTSLDPLQASFPGPALARLFFRWTSLSLCVLSLFFCLLSGPLVRAVHSVSALTLIRRVCGSRHRPDGRRSCIAHIAQGELDDKELLLRSFDETASV